MTLSVLGLATPIGVVASRRGQVRRDGKAHSGGGGSLVPRCSVGLMIPTTHVAVEANVREMAVNDVVLGLVHSHAMVA